MKCEDVQGMIWSGETSAEMEQHLQTCENCQSDDREMKQMIGAIGNIQTPLPTRSLQPSREIIRQTVKRNRRQRWMGVTTIAASLVLVVGVGLFAAQTLLPGENPAPPVEDPDQKQQLEVVIATDVHPEFTAAIKEHLLKVISKSDVRKITITNYEPVAGISSDYVIGQVTMEYERVPDGTDVQTGYVRFGQENGKWVANLIEQEILPKTPEEAVRVWAQAMQKRDGLLEYSVLHPTLKRNLVDAYKERNWLLDTSTRPIESFSIEKVTGGSSDAQTEEFKVTMNITPFGDTPSKYSLTVRTQKSGQHHYVQAKIYYLNPHGPFSLFLPNGSELTPEDTDLTAWQDMYFQLAAFRIDRRDSYLGESVLFGPYGPNTATPANLPNLPGALIYEYVGEPQNPVQAEQLFLCSQFVDTADPTMNNVYRVSVTFKGDKEAAKKKLLEAAKEWRLPESY